MKTHHIIAIFLSLNLLFSNMAWAMDQCGLITGLSHNISISTSTSSTSILLDSSDLTLSESTALNNSSDETCKTFCAGWIHFNVITLATPSFHRVESHSSIEHQLLHYYYLRLKPPTEPPKV